MEVQTAFRMPVETAPAKVKVEDFASTFRDQFISLNPQFSYFCSPAMAEDDLRQYLHEPIGTLPTKICLLLPKHVAIVLVPFLEKTGPKNTIRISFESVVEAKQVPAFAVVSASAGRSAATLLFAIKDEEVSDYHYGLFNQISTLIANVWPNEVRDSFVALIRSEVDGKVNGEVDEKSWRLKQELSGKNGARDLKAIKEYARQAFEDTLTLYLHGICCDIDVETGPRQLPSRYVRKRLELLHGFFPPPEGHAVFPEELKRP